MATVHKLSIAMDIEPCKHENSTEGYSREDRGYPDIYKCPDCGSQFPTVGDTDLWGEGIRATNIRVSFNRG